MTHRPKMASELDPVGRYRGRKFQNLQVNFYYVLSYFWPIIWLYIAILWTSNDFLGKINYKKMLNCL